VWPLRQLWDALEFDSNGYWSERPEYWVVYVGELNRGRAGEYAQTVRNYGYEAYAQEVTG
jgi:hypothetical protein